jgi:hypothetical protein
MPGGHQVAVSPVDPSFLVLETTFGLMISHDSGSTFAWVCESPIGYDDGSEQDPSIGVTPKYILAGVREGLSLSGDGGCSWSFATSDPVIDLVVRPDDPHTVLALTSKYIGVGDAGENVFATRVLASHDDGASWSQQGTEIDPQIEVATIDVAAGDPNRIYVGGSRRHAVVDGGIERVAIVLASIDAGGTYAETTIPLNAPDEADQGAAFVSAVDPRTADRVFVRIAGNVADRLLVSDDHAATFRTVYQGVGKLLGFALSGDGSRVFVGGPSDGVALASASSKDSGATTLSFFQNSKVGVSCLSWANGKLYACAAEPNNVLFPELAVSTDYGATLVTKFRFACMSGALLCPGGTIAARCNPGLPPLRASLGSCDGGISELGAAAAMTHAQPKTGCGCAAGGATAGTRSLSVLALLAWMAGRRRRWFASWRRPAHSDCAVSFGSQEKPRSREEKGSRSPRGRT